MTSPPAVQLKGVTVMRNNDHILRNIDFSVPQGSTQFILGQSGAGKTTLLKVINGIISPKQGEVYIAGIKLQQRSLRSVRKRIGYIPQSMALIDLLTTRENILLGALSRISPLASLFNIFPKQEQEQADYLLEMMELSEKKDVPVYQLSGGQKRRVAIARALMQRANVILADEILSDLDFVRSNFIMKKIAELKDHFQCTVIFVEHDLHIAQKFAEHVAVLQQGKIIEGIDPAEITHGALHPLFS